MATRHDDCPEAEANDATNGLLLKAAKFASENRPLLPPKNNESFEPIIDFEGFLLFVSGRVSLIGWVFFGDMIFSGWTTGASQPFGFFEF